MGKTKVLQLAIWAELGSVVTAADDSRSRCRKFRLSFSQQKRLRRTNPDTLLFSNRLTALTCAFDSNPSQE